MRHRHLNTTEWTLDAIDSALERGDLPDWRELFAAAKADETLARNILEVADWRRDEASHALARHLVTHIWPSLAGSPRDS